MSLYPTGNTMVEAISIWCPHCDNFIADPDSGSSLIDRSTKLRAGQVHTCFDCGQTFRLPSLVAKLGDTSRRGR